MEIEKLKDACSILGLDYEEFISIPEVEKGVVDYKAAYEQQKILNEMILSNIGEVSKSFEVKFEEFKNKFDEGLEGKIEELNKSFGFLKEEINEMKNTPMRKQKSATKVTVIEKALNQNNGAKKIFNLSDFTSTRELKRFLGDKAIDDLQKGVVDSIYEKAAIQLDASRTVSPDLIKKIFEKDNILIQK